MADCWRRFEWIAEHTAKMYFGVEKGPSVRCELDTNAYPKGIKVADAEMRALNLTGDEFHPDWNYSIAPRE